MKFYNFRFKNSFISHEQIDVGSMDVNKISTPTLLEEGKQIYFEGCRFDDCSFYVDGSFKIKFKECEFVGCVMKSDGKKRFEFAKSTIIGCKMEVIDV